MGGSSGVGAKKKGSGNAEFASLHPFVEWILSQTGEPCGRDRVKLLRLQLHQDSSYISYFCSNGCWCHRSAVERRRFGGSLGSLRTAEGGKSGMSPWKRSNKLTKNEVAQILEDFVEGNGSPCSWDGFTLGMTLEDDYLDSIRMRCIGLSEEFPPSSRHEYCNPRGIQVIRAYIQELRNPK